MLASTCLMYVTITVDVQECHCFKCTINPCHTIVLYHISMIKLQLESNGLFIFISFDFSSINCPYFSSTLKQGSGVPTKLS